MKHSRLAKIAGVLLAGSATVVSLTGATGTSTPIPSPAHMSWKVASTHTTAGASAQAKATRVSPQLDPGTIGLCNAGFGNVSVKSWDNNLGHIDLFCGDGNSGYIHIRDGGDGETGHQAEWQYFGNEASPTANWDDLMAGATGDAILTDSTPTDQGNQKLCYTSTVNLINNDTGAIVDSIQSTIIVSSNNKLVITSYPTHYVSDC